MRENISNPKMQRNKEKHLEPKKEECGKASQILRCKGISESVWNLKKRKSKKIFMNKLRNQKMAFEPLFFLEKKNIIFDI